MEANNWWNTHEYGVELMDEFKIMFTVTFVVYEFPDRPNEKIGDVLIHCLEFPERMCYIQLPWEE